MTKRDFKGQLGARVAPRKLGLLMSDAEKRKRVEAWVAEDFKKLDLLCAEYGIPAGPGQHTHLALALARDFVEGFKETKPDGRPAKWGDFELMMLVVEVERLIEPGKRNKGVSWATTQLASREPWKSFVGERESEYGPDPGEALRTQYKAARKSKWAKVARAAFELHRHDGTTAEWNCMVHWIGGEK